MIHIGSLNTLDIIFENSDFAVLNKASGIHSVAGKDDKSIASILREHFPELSEVSSDFGLLQRLDFETSGCLLIAKTKDTYQKLYELQQAGKVIKTYQAIVQGKWDKSDFNFKSYLGNRYRGSKKVTVLDCDQEIPKRFQLAESEFKFIKYIKADSASLIEIKISSGKRHQIRAQAAHLGFPLLGDSLYGSKLKRVTGFSLHCQKLEFSWLEEELEIEANIDPWY